MSVKDKIVIKGASQNNLKNIDIDIPKHKLVVMTGVSGSGKSSLAFDTIYAEGYRRYVENLSSHARFFLHSVKKPKVKRIENLSPAIAIDQKSDAHNPRSTVGTVTDIYDFLRTLYSQVGKPFCPTCGVELKKQDEKQLVLEIKKMKKNTQIVILGTWKGKQRTSKEKLSAIAGHGYSKVRINEKVHAIAQVKEGDLDDNVKIQIVVDRISHNPKHFDKERIIDSLQTAAKISKGEAVILVDNEDELHYSKHFSCPQCGFSLKDISPKNFSFNSPEGACSRCTGLGEVYRIDPDKVIPNRSISINEGAIMPWSRAGGRISGDSLHAQILKGLAKKYRFSLNVPIKKISKEKIKKILFGTDGEVILIKTKDNSQKEIIFKGISKELEDKHKSADSMFVRGEVEKYLSKQQCPECEGRRLQRPFLNIYILGKTIDQLVSMEIETLRSFLEKHLKEERKKTTNRDGKIISQIFSEIVSRLQPLNEVGLGYIDLNRSTQTLSGGEFQRVRLATQLYSGLSDVVYVLDEPSIGLHAKDTQKLIKTLRKLQKAGNSIIVVEHDRDIICAADYIVDIGPKAGTEGGSIIFQGTVSDLRKAKTQTAKHLFKKGLSKNKKKKITRSKQELRIIGAKQNNLKNIDVSIPLSKFVSVVGVSGGGKSSFVNDIVAKALRKKIHGYSEDPGQYDSIEGINNISKVVIIDQASIGRSPRSNAATYTRIFGHIRKLFAMTEEAEKCGYTASHFSFNMRGGRCEYCQGEGVQKIEMHLLNNVYANCSHCNGTRYSKKMLEVQYHGATIVDVLNMNVEYAYHFFSSNKLIVEKLKSLKAVGLGYLRLGQNANELSGGEAQRIKLATELARKSNGNTLYILDEPTVGLHFSDVQKLLCVLRGLVNANNSILVVEHNLDIIEASDWVIELGPGGGNKGGEIIFEGTPDQLKEANTPTGKIL